MKSKTAGNYLFARGALLDALNEYERALGVFQWITAQDKDWMKKVGTPYDLPFSYIVLLNHHNTNRYRVSTTIRFW